MKIENLKTFLVVAELANIHKAADALFLSHQNVSFIIKNMEKELGVALFRRSRKGMQLTEEGHAFLQMAQSVVASYEDFLNTYVNPERVKVVTIYTTSAIAGYLSDLYEFTVSKNHIFSITTKYNVEEILQMIADNHQGIYLFPIVDGDLKTDITNYEKTVLLQDKIVTIVHKESAYAKRGVITDKDLKTMPFLAGNSSVDKNIMGVRINIDNLEACKKIMQEKHYCYRDTLWVYNKFFRQDDQWTVLEGKEHLLEYVVVMNLSADIKKIVDKSLIPKLQTIFSS